MILVGLLAMDFVGMGSAQGPGKGFSVLLCVAEGAGSGPGNAQVSVEVLTETDVQIDGDLREVEIIIYHGQSSSQHIVEYEDDGNEQLNCGDSILSVD
jgi:hypothetical protein